MSQNGKQSEIQTEVADTEKQELTIALKQKLRENKNLLSKNTKLQNKYVDLFKEHKNVKKDHQTFIALLKKIFNYEFQELAVGAYSLENLEQIWAKKEEQFNLRVHSLLESTEMDKQQLRDALQRQHKEELTSKESQSVTKKEDEKLKLDGELKRLTEENKDLKLFVTELEKKLAEGAEQLSKMSREKLKLQHDVNKYKSKEIQKEFRESEKQQEQKSTQERNEYLAMKQQLNSTLIKQDNLKKQLKSNIKEIAEFKQTLAKKNQEIKQLQQKLQLTGSLKKESIKESASNGHNGASHSKQQSYSSKIDIEDPELFQQIQKEYIHRRYFKNILLSYFSSLNQNNNEKAQKFNGIIATLLKLSKNEAEIIQLRKSWWNLI